VEEPKNELEGKTVQKEEKESQRWDLGISEYCYLRAESRIRRAARSEPYLAGGVPRSQFDGQSVDLVGEPYAERRVVFPRMNPDTNQSPRFRCFHIGACVTPLGSG
jgi:hypothetical protein